MNENILIIESNKEYYIERRGNSLPHVTVFVRYNYIMSSGWSLGQTLKMLNKHEYT